MKKIIAGLAAVLIGMAGLSLYCEYPLYAKADYSTATKSETIQTDISNAQLGLEKSVYFFTGKAVKPSVSLTLEGITLDESVDYTISCSNNIKVGTATVICTGKGAYSGIVKKTFTINPARQEIQRLSTEYKDFFIDWVMKGSATGYEITYADNKDFTGAKNKIITSYKTDKTTISNLVGGRRYYVKVRSYTLSGGKRYCGEWSDTKSIVTSNVNKYPSDVAVTKYTSNSSSVTLSWNKAVNADGYRIYQKKNGVYRTIKVIKSSATTSYTVTGLSAGTDYDFTIRAFKTINKTDYLSKKYTPEFTATASQKVKISSVSATGKTITLKWNKVNATGYRIYQKISGKWVRLCDTENAGITSYKVTGLNKNTSYDFCIRAYKRDKTKRYNAGALTYKTVRSSAISVPDNITTIENTGSVQISWRDKDKTGNYKVYRFNGKNWIEIATTDETSYIDTYLTPDKKYSYRIKEISGYTYELTNTIYATTKSVPDGTTDRDLWVGDSRTVGLSMYQNIRNISKVGEGYFYLMDNMDTICSAKNCNIILCLGVNGMNYVDSYIDAYNEIYNRTKSTCKVYVMTVNQCSGKYSYLSSQVTDFNQKLRNKLNKNIKIIDTYTYLNKNGFTSPDGLHYDMATYSKIYRYTMYVVHGKYPY